ncbi:MAG: penicillin-binding transpeptidase domain-containing protein, partial [Clostridia bacterium]
DLHLATPATPVLDEMTDFNGYYPHNYNDKYEGWTTINNAVTHSLNVPAVKTLNMIGIDGSKKYLNKMAIDNAKDNNLSLALGNFSNGMTIKKLNECYMCLANYGEYSNSSAIKKITYKGKIIYIHANERTKVFETSSAFLMTSILQNTPLSGTAKAIGKTSYDLAVKTGTVGNSNGNTDAYLCGYTPKNTFTFWMGGENMNNLITGGKLAEGFGKKFLINNYSKKYKEKFYVPSNVRLLGIDKIELCQNQLIMLAGADINENETEYFYFDINNAPKEFSKRKILNNYDNINVNSISSSNISLTLPKVEQNQTIKLHKKRLNIEEEFVVVNTEYCDYNVRSGENYFYYYTIEVFGKEIFRSVEIQVSIPDSENSKDDNQNLDNKDKNWFTDFWYIR